jgi:TolB-like protein/class 3 adenylate cyclase/tetratricopeptide (TPR) repeat protein
MTNIPTGTVTFLFTDIEGSTQLWQQHPEAMAQALERHHALLSQAIEAYDGYVFQIIGDAFCAAFHKPLNGLQAALAAQRALNQADWGEIGSLKVRMALHTGAVEVQPGEKTSGEYVSGITLSRAARLLSAGHGGQILLTQTTCDLVRDGFLPGIGLIDLGEHRLKDLVLPEHVHQLTASGLPADFPPLKAYQAPDIARLPRDRVAVLPFTNISQDSSDEYFADGMTEELISSVSKMQGLRVIARTSVMRYKATRKSIAEIGRELNVGSVLEGSVRKAGDMIRVTVQFVETSDEEPRWSQDYDRQISDVFAIQSDIAMKVAEALREHVLGGLPRLEERKATNSPEAYIGYLRGRQLWNKRTEQSLKKSIGFFQEALAIDGSYAKAYTGLADSYATLALLEFMPPNEAYPMAKEAVRMALALDANLVEAHTSLGLIKFQYDWDWRGAEREFNEAIRINPSYASAHHFFADYLKAMGRFKEALAEIDKAYELDPLSLAINTGVGHVLYLSRQYDKAIEQYRKAVELDPAIMATHVWFGRPYLEKGMFAEAIAELETGVRLSGESTMALAMLGHGLASAGRKEEALQILERLKERSGSQYVPSYWIAVIYNGLKDRGQVNAWMRKAFEERSSWLVWSNVEPRFDWLKDDPDFASLMGEMRFP